MSHSLTEAEFDRLTARSPAVLTAEERAALEPYRVRRAVFLAAGFGSRLRPITGHTPKPLVRVRGRRIIDTLLDACLGAGIGEIYIVRGHLAGQFDALLEAYPMVRFLDNPFYPEANNISSALCARHLLSNAYVLEADLLLAQPALIQPYQYRSNFLAFPTAAADDWCFTVRDGIITEEKLGGRDCWQMVGISYWGEADGQRLAADLAAVWEEPEGRTRYWEQVPLDFRREHYRVAVRACKPSDVTEIDTLEELQALDSRYKEEV